MASPTLQFKRGLVVNLPALRAGEPGFTTDKNDFYIGGADGNKFFGSHRYWTKEDGSNALKLNLVDKNGSNSLAVKAPDTLANSNTVYTLPAAPTDGYFLKTNASGTLEWSSVTSGASFDGVTITNSTFTGVSTFSGLINSTGGASFSGITTIGTADINGGNIDGTVIGGSTADAGTFTQLNYSNSSTTGISTVGSLFVGTDSVLTAPGGTLTLSNIEAIDATTKATLEASLALDPNNFDSLSVAGIATFTGMVYANGGVTGNLTGVASTATKLQNARDFSITGDFITATSVSFDGTGNVALGATITANSIALGTYTTGDYVATVAGTANQISVSGSGSETASVILSLPNDVVVGTSLSVTTLKTATIQHSNGTEAITITSGGNVGVSTNLTVSGDLIVNGTTTQVNTTSLTVEDTLIDLGLVDGAAPSSDLNKDLGLLFNYYSGSAKKAAVYWSDSASRIAFASEASESSSVITATTYATILAGGLEINNACTGGTDAVISCVGEELALSNIVFDGGIF